MGSASAKAALRNERRSYLTPTGFLMEEAILSGALLVQWGCYLNVVAAMFKGEDIESNRISSAQQGGERREPAEHSGFDL